MNTWKGHEEWKLVDAMLELKENHETWNGFGWKKNVVLVVLD